MCACVGVGVWVHVCVGACVGACVGVGVGGWVGGLLLPLGPSHSSPIRSPTQESPREEP